MKLIFSKYQGTGNDFILLDNRSGNYSDLTIPQIQFLCDRKFGIGADGLIKINSSSDLAFEVDYYNSDGSKSFCGNGARCAVSYANFLGIDTSNVVFTAIDGIHEASQKGELIELKMSNVHEVHMFQKDYVLYTGSPHYIKFKEDTFNLNVFEEGRKIRYSEEFKEEGINVNFVEELKQNELEVLTYERGVEDETLSCGTGVTAAAIAYAVRENLEGEQSIQIHTKGGKLKVKFTRTAPDDFVDVYLIGPAVQVFNGAINLD